MAIHVFQRLSVYGYWPESKTISSEPFHVTVGKPPKDIVARIFLQTYKNRPSYNFPAKIASSKFRHGYPVLEKSNGFYVGKTFYSHAVGDVVGQLQMEQPFEGEVDVFIEIKEDKETEEDLKEVHSALAPFVSAFLLSLCLKTKELFSLKGDVEVFKEQKNSKNFKINIEIGGTVERKWSKLSTLKSCIDDFPKLAASKGHEEAIQVGVVARRIFNARHEVDIIDKFCDYWEACEFICSGSDYEKYNDKSMRVAVGLAPLYNETLNSLWEILTKPIYEIRNGIVHEYATNDEAVRHPLEMLDDMACALFASKMGMPPPNDDSVVKYFSGVRNGTIKPMRRKEGPENFRLPAKV